MVKKSHPLLSVKWARKRPVKCKVELEKFINGVIRGNGHMKPVNFTS